MSSKTFWILSGLYMLVIATVLFGVQGFLDNIVSSTGNDSPVDIPSVSVYRLPDIWHNLTFIAGFFKIILAVIIIITITNEYAYKTIRQNIIAGLSRADFLKSKVLFIFLISLSATVLLLILGLILGFINTIQPDFSGITEKMIFLPAYLLEVFSYLCFAFMVGFLVKRSGIAIGLMLLYAFIIEPVINYRLPSGFEGYMPLKSINNLIDIPNTALMQLFGVQFRNYISLSDVILVLAYTTLFLLISHLVLKKRDL